MASFVHVCLHYYMLLMAILFTSWYHQSYRFLSLDQVAPSFVAPHVLLKGVCCFTKTALFTTIVLVCSLKSMCIPSFVVVSVSYTLMNVPIVMYGLRVFYKNYNVYRVVDMLQ